MSQSTAPNPTFSSAGVAAYFHPFKILPVYTALKLTSAQSSPLQYLLYDQGLITIAKSHKSALNRSTPKQTFTDALEFANCLSEICIAFEPVGYRSVFRTIRWRYPDSERAVIERFEERLKEIGPKLEQIGLETIEEFRKHLVQEAEIVEGNKRLHMIVRLTNATERAKLKGDIGLSTIFLTMAEILRRASEKHFSVKIPEEDELGFGQWMPDARKLLYGTERILDADRTTLVTFMEQVGLNHGTKIRCYVEGVTEAGALNYVFEDFSSIVVIDLGGLVVQKRGKGVAFRDSLRTDIREKVFSFVFIDGDRSDYLSAVKKAAADGDIVGGYFVSDPDFELQNFSINELLNVACSVSQVHLSDDEMASTLKELAKCKSGSEFFKNLKNADSRFIGISKGAAWGEGLMKLAVVDDKEREITSAAKFVLSGLHVGHSMHKENFQTDVKSGRPVKVGHSKYSDGTDES